MSDTDRRRLGSQRGTATPAEGTSTAAGPSVSTGELEQMVLDLVRARLGD